MFYTIDTIRRFLFADVSGSNIKDLSQFAGYHTVTARNCPLLKNVNPLRDCKNVNLTGCKGVKDVSALGNVHTLNLTYCTEVKDVSALKNVHTLNLTYCTGVKDICMLYRVQHLDITGCNSIKKLDWPKNPRKKTMDTFVCIGRFEPFLQIEGIGCAKNIDMSYGSGEYIDWDSLAKGSILPYDSLVLVYTDIPHGTNVKINAKYLDMSHTDINSNTFVVNVRKINMSGCHLINNDLTPFGGAEEIDLTGCSDVRNVEPLANCSKVILNGCKNVTDVSELNEVKILDIEGCTGVLNDYRDPTVYYGEFYPLLTNNVSRNVDGTSKGYIWSNTYDPLTRIRFISRRSVAIKNPDEVFCINP